MKGKLITIEGIDGSGKGTQADLLVSKLVDLGYPVKKYTFPTYTQSFYGKMVGEFLNGDYGTLDQVHPKLACMLFANDRLSQRERMLRDLEAGEIIICDRYVESNMAHQGAKIDDKEACSDFIRWLEILEYSVNKMPRPNSVFFLNIKPEIAAELVLKKAKRDYTDKAQDIQEADQTLMQRSHEMYCRLRRRWGGYWYTIDAVDYPSDELLSIEQISTKLFTKVLDVIAS